jgi:phosphatidylserine/phosphatidylglycerophosphate/cardiolipin synthase-like enzyme
MIKIFMLIFILFANIYSPFISDDAIPTVDHNTDNFSVHEKSIGNSKIQLYTPSFSAFNIKEEMVLSPIFTPDNALDLYVYWINKANSTLKVQNPYFRTFDSGTWSTDSSPIVKAIVDAKSRGVAVQVQINLDRDNDNITQYFQGLGIDVKGMGKLASSPDDNYLSETHNKLVIIDDSVVIISSINFSETAFKENREAGMIIQNVNVANHFTQVFDADWTDGEIPLFQNSKVNTNLVNKKSFSNIISNTKPIQSFPSHTNIPRVNFTGVYNVTVFTNPDNADEVIFRYLESAKESIYVSMYTFSRPDFNNTLIELKQANPSIDIQVLISNRRVGASENEDTFASATSLVNNLILVYNSTKDDDKVNGFYHNKYWIIDGKHVFIYSGNWSPKSTTPSLEPGDTSYSSGEANRDMGIAVHDSPEIASFFTDEVWKKDVAVADAWPLSTGLSVVGISDGDVISNNMSIQGVVTGNDPYEISVQWDEKGFNQIEFNNLKNTFQYEFDTNSLANGIHSFEVKVVTNTSQILTKSFKVTVANYDPINNWRVLLTEVLANPSTVDDVVGEFYEITNTFPFPVLLEGWTTGDDKNFFTFPE